MQYPVSIIKEKNMQLFMIPLGLPNPKREKHPPESIVQKNSYNQLLFLSTEISYNG